MIVFTADLHFTSRRFGDLTEHYRRVWEEVLEAASRADLFVILGDIVHVPRDVKLTDVAMFCAGLNEVAVPTVVIRGNHDPIELFTLLKEAVPRHVELVTEPSCVETAGYRIACLPFVEHLDQRDALAGLPEADMLILHGTVEGVVFPSGVSAEEFVPLQLLRRWPLVACGHIHSYQVCGENAVVFYPGSLMPTDFGDLSQKGYVVLKPGGKPVFTPVSAPAVEVVSITVGEEPMRDVAEGVSKLQPGCIVRLDISGHQSDLARIDYQALKAMLPEPVFYELIVQPIERVKSEEVIAGGITALPPAEQLRAYLEREGVELLEEVYAKGLGIIESRGA
ncbi:MAG: metallophosphoesterase [Bacillota bacterium]